MARVLMPLPDRDFDVTETAVPWKVLTRAGHEVVFATEAGGKAPAADPLLLTGVIFGKLGAAPEAKAFYAEMQRAPSFQAPLSWSRVDPAQLDGLILPGGHAPGMRQYLGNEDLQKLVAGFCKFEKPLGAICHGVLVAARAGVLRGRKTTCLPKYMERLAWWSTAWKLGRYYRTYPAYVEDEVKASLAASGDFVRGPLHLTARGTDTDDSPAFVVEDGSYVSARWPGDAWLFAKRFLARLPGNQASIPGA